MRIVKWVYKLSHENEIIFTENPAWLEMLSADLHETPIEYDTVGQGKMR